MRFFKTRYLALLATILAVLPALALAQGGPPFISDDPDTPGNGHWEINMIFTGERNPFQGSYESPNIDINYGLGNRIQLKYELPLSIAETRGGTHEVDAGLGNSLLGVKYRYYEHHSQTHERDGEKEVKFSTSIYPQIVLNNPTRSVARGIVDRGPELFLPVEANAEINWLRISAETGYWFNSKEVPNSWIRGVVAGHEFRKDTELYLEFYDQTDLKSAFGIPASGETTIGIGGRIPIVKMQWLRLIGMVGHGLVSATPVNHQPTWIGSIGLQFLSEERRRHGDEP